MADAREFEALHNALSQLLAMMKQSNTPKASAKVTFVTGDVFTLVVVVKPKRRRQRS